MSSEAFPRGGLGGGTSAVDSKHAPKAGGAPPEALFGHSAGRTKRIEVVDKKKKKSSNVNSGSGGMSSIAGLGGILSGGKNASGDAKVGLGHTRLSANNKTLKIEPITFAKYTPNTLALGFVLQINDDRAIISLPGGVVGTVELAEVSDVAFRHVSAPSTGQKKRKLNDKSSKKTSSSSSQSSSDRLDIRSLLHLMQPVRCVVLGVQDRPSTSNKKNLALSLRSSLINKHISFKHLMPEFPISGCIVSKEDHGYIVSAGIGGVNFFLPSKNIPASMGEIIIGKNLSTISYPSLIFIKKCVYMCKDDTNFADLNLQT